MLRRCSRTRLPASPIAWLPRLVVALSIILSATRGTGSRSKQKSFLFAAAATAAVAKKDNNQEEDTVFSSSFESFGVGTGHDENNQDYENFNRRHLTSHQAFQFSASAHACLLAYHMVQCVGYNYYGQIGQSSSTEFGSPVQLMFPGITSAKPIKVVTGYDHTCTLFTDKHVWCNGSNGFQQLGNVSTGNSATPVQVQEGNSIILVDVVDIAAGAYHNCAIKSTGAMYCWGFNVDGQLGMNSIMDGSSTGTKAVQMALSMSATCVVTEEDSSKVNCVGFDYSNTDKAFTVVDLGNVVTTQTGKQGLAAGSTHFCALLDNTKAKCWGTNHTGQLGIGSAQLTKAYHASPVFVLQDSTGTELSGIMDIKAAYSSTCLVASGRPMCFGNNRSYQMGIANGGVNVLYPTLVASIDNITGKILLSMHVGEYTGHAVFDDNSVYSVGTNRGGTFGDGSTISSQNIIGNASTDIAKQISFVIGSDEPSLEPQSLPSSIPSFLPSNMPSDIPSSQPSDTAPIPTIQWAPVASQGSLYDADGNVDANQFRTIWASSPRQILHRKCLDCVSSHQDIYYRRFDGVGGLPSDLDLLDTVKSNWFDSPHNSFNVDFKLYSSYVDAIKNTNAWTFCNFNDPGVGFPRDCGPTGAVGGNWNSFSGRRNELNLGFYVETLVFS